ncbi:MAG: hypothetical protein E7679_04805 [Ruminococcaceae bacterium]|nr:hypothetical protein [Oscillospiraceae bacterium]
MYEELCEATGEERLALINELEDYEFDRICFYAKSCKVCPLALHYGNGDLLCLDYASVFKIKDIFKKGGYFIPLKGL